MSTIPTTIETVISSKSGSPLASTTSCGALAPAPASSPAAVSSSKNSRYKDWFRPKRWSLRRAPSLPTTASSSFIHQHHQHTTASSELSKKDQHKKDLEDLTAATWNRERRIALLDPSEIKLEDGSSYNRVCNVESITLERTAEYLQQEKYRLQLQVKSKKQLYSIKRIHPNPSTVTATKNGLSAKSKKKGLKLLVQEATILAKLGDHPNIIPLRALPFKSCHCNDFFILTDRLHKDTLEIRIQQWQQEGKSAFSSATWDPYVELYGGDEYGDDDDTIATPNDDMIPRKTNYAFQIAKALQACHKAGIVVRDLSPQTIGFRQDDPHCIQLVDLGHAQEVDPAATATSLSSSASTSSLATTTAKASLVGKRRYLAGEIWKTGQYSFKTDVYSWAMIYYEMCMERKPFLGYSVNEHQTYVWEKGDRPLLASCYLPEGIDKIMLGAWAHRPEERLTINEVVHKTQTLLMHLDSCIFWDETDGDFLFDVFVPCTNDDDEGEDVVSELAEEELEEDLLLGEVESVLEQQSDAHLTLTDDCLSPSTSVGSSEKPSRGSNFTARQLKLISSAA